jgi:hypothetical protein
VEIILVAALEVAVAAEKEGKANLQPAVVVSNSDQNLDDRGRPLIKVCLLFFYKI